MRSVDDPRPSLGAIVVRAFVYALAICTLVVFSSGSEHAFVYLGF